MSDIYDLAHEMRRLMPSLTGEGYRFIGFDVDDNVGVGWLGPSGHGEVDFYIDAEDVAPAVNRLRALPDGELDRMTGGVRKALDGLRVTFRR